MTLRIKRSDESGWVVFALSGRIQTDQVPELSALLQPESRDHRLLVDLKEVRLVDRDAVRFLARLESQGARLRNCSAFIRQWILQERNGGATRRQNDQQL